MSGTFGSFPFGGPSFDEGAYGRRIACLGDSSSHGGTLTTTNQDNKYTVSDIAVCANGCSHNCPIIGHGTTQVTAVTIRSYVNGKLIVTYGARAGCGAVVTPPERFVYCE